MSSEKYESRPDISGKKLDFSGFHPTGDHWPWQCGDLPGGWHTHVKYAWEFRYSREIRRQTLCRVGRHSPGQWWQGDLTWIGCIYCHKQLSEPQPE